MKIEYSANNSGGSWWLTDDDWRKLEAAGWYVVWGGLYFCDSKSSRSSYRDPRDEGLPELCGPEVEQGKCHGHRRAQTAAAAEKIRWLGALAREAYKDFPSLTDAIRDFERITGADASDEGCNCCGPPHSFSTREEGQYEYASGSDIVALLYPSAPKSLREAAERLEAESQ